VINLPTAHYRTALITGASAGIGAEFARQLAAQGTSLILVARRIEKLEALANELHHKYPITSEILQADLTKPDAVARVETKLSTIPDLDLLINNAGFGSVSRFYDGEPGPQMDMLQVHIATCVQLTRAALPAMVTRQRGWIINVASVAAFAPFGSVLYPATKSFLVTFSQGLSNELHGTGIKVQALCPGLTNTEFHDVIRMDRTIAPKFLWLPAERVVSTSLKALPSGSVIVVPGWQYRLIVAFARIPLISSLIQVAAASGFLKRRIRHDQHP
jgi:short-subunit dehydrogenase